MDEFLTILTIVVIACVVTGGIYRVLSFVEKLETDNFWECIGENNSIDMCVNKFEYDREIRIDGFYCCMEEMNKLEYCHTKFLR